MNKKELLCVAFSYLCIGSLFTLYWYFQTFPEQNPFIKIETINLEPGTRIRYLIHNEDYIRNSTTTKNADVYINDINSTYVSYTITYMDSTETCSYFFNNPESYGMPPVVASNLNVGDEINYMNLTINRTEIRTDFLGKKLCVNVIEINTVMNNSESVGTILLLVYYEKSSGLCLYSYTRWNYTTYDYYSNILDKWDYLSYDKIDYIS